MNFLFVAFYININDFKSKPNESSLANNGWHGSQWTPFETSIIRAPKALPISTPYLHFSIIIIEQYSALHLHGTHTGILKECLQREVDFDYKYIS